VSSKPIVKFHHENDVHGPLTLDLLQGSGLNNKENRRVTAQRLAADARNHPAAPTFEPLSSSSSSFPSLPEHSFVHASPAERPAALGPHIEEAPSKNERQAPKVLRTPIPPSFLQADSLSSPYSSERALALQDEQKKVEAQQEKFVQGLPKAFLQLDAATQVAILHAVDADMQAEEASHHESETEDSSETESESEESADQEQEDRGEQENEQENESEQEEYSSLAETDSSADELLDEVESAAPALRALASLQESTHAPIKKLLRLLAEKE